jgi:hypothetical protein
MSQLRRELRCDEIIRYRIDPRGSTVAFNDSNRFESNSSISDVEVEESITSYSKRVNKILHIWFYEWKRRRAAVNVSTGPGGPILRCAEIPRDKPCPVLSGGKRQVVSGQVVTES